MLIEDDPALSDMVQYVLRSAGLTFRAWDRTVGTPGALADVTYNGGPFAYSAATATS